MARGQQMVRKKQTSVTTPSPLLVGVDLTTNERGSGSLALKGRLRLLSTEHSAAPRESSLTE